MFFVHWVSIMVRSQTITIILRYRDPGTAAKWLCQVFGFHQDHVAKGPTGQISYVALRLGDSFVLLCPVANTDLDTFMVQPQEVNGASTQVCYLTVGDLDGHWARAQAEGAKIEFGPEEDAAGDRFYICRDLEGHLWSFGTRAYGVGSGRRDRRSGQGRLPRNAMAVTAAILAVGGWILYEANFRSMFPINNTPVMLQSAAHNDAVRDKLADAAASQAALELTAQEMAEQLKKEQSASVEFRNELRDAQAELIQMQVAKEEMDRAMAAANKAKSAAEQATRDAVAALDLERTVAAQLQTRVTRFQQSQIVLRLEVSELQAELLAERRSRFQSGQQTAIPEQSLPIATDKAAILTRSANQPETKTEPPEKKESGGVAAPAGLKVAAAPDEPKTTVAAVEHYAVVAADEPKVFEPPKPDRLAEARALVESGDIEAARALLEPLAAEYDPTALLLLSETFDPNMLAAWDARRTTADADRAREFYKRALAQGEIKARHRLKALE